MFPKVTKSYPLTWRILIKKIYKVHERVRRQKRHNYNTSHRTVENISEQSLTEGLSQEIVWQTLNLRCICIYFLPLSQSIFS